MDWQPGRYFPSSKASFKPYALLVLNQPLTPHPISSLWDTASAIVCADGGANRLYDLVLDGQDRAIPHAIIGDLDSLRDDVREAYETCGTEIVLDAEQNSTDLQKSLRYIRWLVDEGATDAIDVGRTDGKRALDVVVVGGMGGRVDSAFSTIHGLYAASQDESQLIGEIFLIGSESLSFVLKEGRNVIHVPRHEGAFTENAGVIPVGRPAVITLKGFEWDVEDWETHFGGAISTSNHIRADVLEVETSEAVLFTLELAGERQN